MNTSLKAEYQRTLEYLFRQLPMFQRIGPKAFKKDLTNIRKLAAMLRDPHTTFPSIHIAGTNGKGSTAHMIAAVLQAHRLKTGLYTSPHYRDFRERIKIDGHYISRKEVVNFVSAFSEQFTVLKPSFFEITVALAFRHFARHKVDLAVIETGLGGRLDSTNIITPLLSVITNIGFDHMEFLGNTLPLIAAEKAGIIKEKVPVVVGEWSAETASVFEMAAARSDAPLCFAENYWRCVPVTRGLTGNTYNVYYKNELRYEEVELGAGGPYQQKNLTTALASLHLLPGLIPAFEIEEPALREGLARIRSMTRFKGRCQVLGTEPLVLADSAHNVDGMRLVVELLQEVPHGQLHMVYGAVKDKDLRAILTLLPASARYYFAKPDVPRGLAADKLKELAREAGLEGKTYSSVRYALRAARRQAQPSDLIFVGGSTFVVAEVV